MLKFQSNFLFSSRSLSPNLKTGRTATAFSFKRQIYSELYDNLFEVIDLINSNFTVHLIFVLIRFVATDIFAFYTVLKEFLSGSEKTFHFELICNIYWISAHFGMKCFIAFMGSSTTKEVEKSSLIILKASVLLDSNHVMQKDLKIIQNQLQIRNRNIENKFFTINWNMILNVSVVPVKVRSFQSSTNVSR
jgi:hypothetical protein